MYTALLAVATVLFKEDRLHSGWLPAEHRLELESIAAIVNVPVGDLVALAGLYDMTAARHHPHHACTSVVAQLANATAPPSHGRNLDYPLASAMLNLTARVEWRRGEHT